MYDSSYLRGFDINKVDVKALSSQMDALKSEVSAMTNDLALMAKKLESAVSRYKKNAETEPLKEFSDILDAFVEKAKKFTDESLEFWKVVSAVQRYYMLKKIKDDNFEFLNQLGTKARGMKRAHEEFSSMVYHLRGLDKGLPVKLKWWSLTIYTEDLDKISDRILFVSHELSKLTDRNESGRVSY